MTKIMLVEDDKSLREIYGVRLLAEGYEITSAGDGEEALAMAVKEHPDLIVSDVMMPKISGFDMLDILRSTPETKDIKIIMMTALSSEDQRARGETLGANRYLVKSQVGIEDVVRTVHEVLEDVPVSTTPVSQDFGAPVSSSGSNSQPFSLPAQPITESGSIPTAPIATQESTTPESKTNTVPDPVQPITPELVKQPTINPIAPIEPAVVVTTSAPEPTPIIVQEPVKTPELVEQPVSAPTAIVEAQPVAIVNPPAPEPVAEVQLPQPTAPFSTSAPSSLGYSTQNSTQSATDTISEPMASPVSAPVIDMATRMSQELNNNPDIAQTPDKTTAENTPFTAP